MRRTPSSLAPLPAIESLLSDLVSQALGVTVRVAMADAPLDEAELAPADRARLDGFSTAERRLEFRRGRAALARALGAAGRRPAQGARRVASLTHSGELAAAVAVAANDARPIAGVGVDLERDRPVRASMARLFLAPSERAWLATLPGDEGERARALLRLWTVKEALFKADPDNAGAGLHEYLVADPRGRTGRAARRGRRADFSYVTVRLPEATLTVAVRHEDQAASWEDRHAVTLAG